MPAAPDVTQTIEPQIVRVRSLEGDVRVARGDAGDAEWEQAEADLPIETGFYLVTGAGRAEIEFEDGSTVYVGENSALTFDNLSIVGGIPHTQVQLLTGMLTLHAETDTPGEVFVLKMPTDRITTTYPGQRYVRVNAFLNAIAMTPQIVAAGRTTAGPTVFHNDGKVVEHEGEEDPKIFADWDRWVAGRVALRDAEIKAVATASGLPASTPGLADMHGQGAFFACAPYGTCWEPPAEFVQAAAMQKTPAPASLSVDGPDFEMIAAPAEQTIYAGDRAKTTISAVGFWGFGDPIDIAATLPPGFTCVTPCTGQISPGQNALTMQFQSMRAISPGTYTVQFQATSGQLAHEFTFTIYVVQAEGDYVPFEPTAAELPEFPCTPSGVHPAVIRTGRGGVHVGYGPRYSWAVCHTGTWIFRHHMYVWVLPTKGDNHHHHPPCRWVKCGNRYCYVPVHPRDERGKLPINCKHDVYRVGDRKGREVERVTFNGHQKLEALDGPPREFRRSENYPLAKADAPKLHAHEMRDAFVAKSAPESPETATSLKFDRESHEILLAKELPGSKKHELVTETFEEHRSGLRVENHHVVPAPSDGMHSASAPSSGNAPHGGGGGTHAGGGTSHTGPSHSGGGASHAGGGGSHTSAPSHTGGGGSHASVPSHTGGGSHSAPAPSATHHK